MEELTLRKAQILAKKLYVALAEIQDVSKQLAEALDRNDQVTVRLLIGMRREPVDKARQTRQALGDLRDDLPPHDADRLTELLNGAEGQTAEERAIAEQVQSNQQLLKQILALDEGLSLKVARDKSVYQNK